MTSSILAGRLGAQQPRVSSQPPAKATAGDDVADLAARAGLVLDPWQRLVLQGALGIRPDGRWAAFEVGLVVPRQSGKGSILEALELAALFDADPDAPPPLVLHSAHEFKTSAEHFRRMRDLIDGADAFRKKVRIVRTAAGSESIELNSGARLRFVTRTGGSGRGFSADLIVIDEAYNLTAEALAAMLPTLSARPNPQVWYTSSAGMQSSSALARIRGRGMAGGDPRLAYFEWSAPDDADLDDRDVWAQANPALGIRIPEEFVEAERAALPDEQFARERLGMWAESDARASAFDPTVWAALADPDAPRSSPVSWGVSVAPDQSWAALCGSWRRADGQVQVQVAAYAPGTSWLSERLAGLQSRWGGQVYLDRFAAALLDGEAVRGAAYESAHAAFAAAVTAGTVRHYGGQNELNVAIRAARWRSSGEGRLLNRKGTTDISPVIAAALALHGLQTAPTSGGWVMAL